MNEEVFKEFPELETERVIMRKVTISDSDLIFEFNSSPETLKYIAREPYTDPEQAREKVEGFLQGFPKGDGVWWGFDLKDTGETIGYGGLFGVDVENDCAEVGYGLMPSYWGQGYASEVVPAIVAFGFQTLGLHRIYGHVDPKNSASARVLQKIGFVREGILRDRFKAGGRYHDMSLFARVANGSRL